MMRSQLSGLEKLDIGRVRRRTSRKARSMTLVVRTLIQWAGGTAKKFSRASRSRSTQATALGRRCCQCCFQSRKARSASLWLLARYMAEAPATQEPSWRETLSAMLRSLWAQQRWHRHVGENERQSGLQSFAAVADD